MREIRKSGSMRGRWKRVYGRPQRGTKLETADTGKIDLRVPRQRPTPPRVPRSARPGAASSAHPWRTPYDGPW